MSLVHKFYDRFVITLRAVSVVTFMHVCSAYKCKVWSKHHQVPTFHTALTQVQCTLVYLTIVCIELTRLCFRDVTDGGGGGGGDSDGMATGAIAGIVIVIIVVIVVVIVVVFCVMKRRSSPTAKAKKAEAARPA